MGAAHRHSEPFVQDFVPELCLADALGKHGYGTVARVSMPVLNPYAGLTRGFDDYRLMGETHYPYMLANNELPRISGVHGVAREMDDLLARSSDTATAEPEFFPVETMRFLHDQQVRCVEYVDRLIGELFAKCPVDTHFIVTADHGELFGEDDYFGHGPVMHQKVFEVPFVEGSGP